MIRTIELALDNAQYADGDLMANPVEIVEAIHPNGSTVIRSIVVVDTDDQGATFSLLFFGSNPGNLGTLNGAMAITDAQAAMCIGHVIVDSYEDVGAQQVGTEANVQLMVRPEDGRTSLWVAAISGGTPTYASGAMTVKIGLERHRE